MDSSTLNEVFIPIGLGSDGKCAIRLKGKTEVKNYLNFDLTPTRSTHWLSWEIKIVFDGVADGRLKIDVQIPTDLKPQSSNDEGIFDSGRLSDFDATFNKTLGVIKTRLQSLKTDLESVFDDKWSFVFSGAKTFFIDRCQFNQEGDLLADLKYKS
ncbi:hypothetical protein DL93DRAFT_1711464 [Clavulina sp. PMI_390]|nr:hypothetical protein DL93DRAFT_1711464 [Clavulina sp. PMI_390]